jgi:hypothetical protein
MTASDLVRALHKVKKGVALCMQGKIFEKPYLQGFFKKQALRPLATNLVKRLHLEGRTFTFPSSRKARARQHFAQNRPHNGFFVQGSTSMASLSSRLTSS